MNFLRSGSVVILIILFLFIFSGSMIYAQGTRTTRGPASTTKASALAPGARAVNLPADQVVKLRKLVGVGRRAMIKHPEYRTSLGGTVGIDKDWVQIALEYVTAPEWVDDLTFQFYAIAETKLEGKTTYSFYKAAVRYADIERGTHVCTMFLRPSAVKRYGELVAVAVEVQYKGAVADEMSEESMKMPPKWWKDPNVTENQATVLRDGYLINRALSPFAMISIEGYEFIR